jgi:amino acid transporter
MSTDQSQANSPTPTRTPPLGTILVLVLAGFFYIGMAVCLSDAQHGDTFGRGLATAFGALLGLIVWILLGTLLAIRTVNGKIPRVRAAARAS